MGHGHIKTRDDIGRFLSEMSLCGAAAEIGVAFGQNAYQILKTGCSRELLLVDPWGYVTGQNPRGFADAIKDWDGCFQYAADLLQEFGERAKFMRMSSKDAASLVDDDSLDFVYIDGNHMSPYVDEDIDLWFPKVRKGGLFGGHDYHNVCTREYQCDVKTAVDKKFQADEVFTTSTDNDPSWFLIKR